VKSSWRVILSGVLLAAALWIFALKQAADGHHEVPTWHVNTDGGFRIRPPAGWVKRTDDRDGTQIAPAVQPKGGFATLIVSTRLARDASPMPYLTDVVARPPAGPIRDLVWLRQDKVTLDDGGPGALGEFTQVYRGMPVHGWMMFSVRDGKLLQVVATVPADRADTVKDAMVQALRSVQPL
jgi:hypothetical protein